MLKRLQFTVFGTVPAFGGQAIQALITLAYVLVLARLLSPATFGIFALAWVWIGFLNLLSDFGLSDVFIRNRSAELNFRPFQTLSRIIGVLMIAVGSLLGLLAGAIYKDFQISLIAISLTPALAFTALANPYRCFLRQKGRFLTLNLISTLSLALSVLLAIAVAWRSDSVLSLILLFNFREGLAWLGFAIWASPDNKIKDSSPSFSDWLRTEGHSGKRLLLFRGVNTLTQRIDQILLGSVVGLETIGIYNRMWTLLDMAYRNLFIPLTQIGLPHLIEKAQTPSPSNRMAALVQFLIATWIPFAVLVFLHPEWIVSIALGDQWFDGIPWLKGLTVAFTAKWIIDLLNLSEIAQQNDSFLNRWSILALGVILGMLLLNLPQHADGVVLALAISYILLAIHRIFALRTRLLPFRSTILKSLIVTILISLSFAITLDWTLPVVQFSLLLESAFVGIWYLAFAALLYMSNHALPHSPKVHD